jgi:hypothetical protein
VRELERLLGRKTMEVEILKEALDLARAKKPILLSHSPAPGDTRWRQSAGRWAPRARMSLNAVTATDPDVAAGARW